MSATTKETFGPTDCLAGMAAHPASSKQVSVSHGTKAYVVPFAHKYYAEVISQIPGPPRYPYTTSPCPTSLCSWYGAGDSRSSQKWNRSEDKWQYPQQWVGGLGELSPHIQMSLMLIPQDISQCHVVGLCLRPGVATTGGIHTHGHGHKDLCTGHFILIFQAEL